MESSFCSRCFCPEWRRASGVWANSWKTHIRCVYYTAVLWTVEQTGCGQIKCLWILSMSLSYSLSLSPSSSCMSLKALKWQTLQMIHSLHKDVWLFTETSTERERGKSGQDTKKKSKAMNEKCGWWDRTTHPLSLSCIFISLPRNNKNVTFFSINIGASSKTWQTWMVLA